MIKLYTYSERTVKKYTIKDAINVAKQYLAEKGVSKLCVTPLTNFREDEKITLEQLNEWVDKLVFESTTYATVYH